MKSILEAAGLPLTKLVKVTVFLADMKDFKRMNDVYGTYFRRNPPARTTVQAQLPVTGAVIEIDAIACSV
jgi:2-iminobutanoate/2-iminopropanoate deaminase